jgi:hypothetical protein
MSFGNHFVDGEPTEKSMHVVQDTDSFRGFAGHSAYAINHCPSDSCRRQQPRSVHGRSAASRRRAGSDGGGPCTHRPGIRTGRWLLGSLKTALRKLRYVYTWECRNYVRSSETTVSVVDLEGWGYILRRSICTTRRCFRGLRTTVVDLQGWALHSLLPCLHREQGFGRLSLG